MTHYLIICLSRNVNKKSMPSSKTIPVFIIVLGLVGCDNKLKNVWEAQPFVNAFNEEQGVALYISGERLTGGLNEARVSFNVNQDLISGGFKEIFSFTLNGTSSWGEDTIEVITPNGEAFVFDIYDGLLFNIDYESQEVGRFIELMNYESLEIRSGTFSFSISTKNFIDLYKASFRAENS